MIISRRAILGSTLGAPLVTIPIAAPALAQSAWPNRPVRVVVPWPPGGSTDVLARLVCEQLSQKLGQPFVIENRPGAGGNIGTDAIAKATPDGYTMGPVTVGGWSINQYLYARLPYDPEKDISPISMHWELPNVLAVPAAHVPATTLAEFVTWAKTKAGGVNFGSPGIGTTPHLSGAMFTSRLGIEAVHVPFRGAAQTIPALLGGDIQFALDNLASYIPVIQGGQMRALAVTSAERWPTLPDVPTMAEAGVPDFVVTSWCAMAFPAGVPAEITERCAAAIKDVSETQAMQDRFLRTGARALYGTPAAAAERAAKERPMWREVVRASGARLE